MVQVPRFRDLQDREPRTIHLYSGYLLINLQNLLTMIKDSLCNFGSSLKLTIKLININNLKKYRSKNDDRRA